MEKITKMIMNQVMNTIGTKIEGKIPIEDDFLNEIINEFIYRFKNPENEDSGGNVIMDNLQKVKVRSHEGKINISFELEVK